MRLGKGKWLLILGAFLVVVDQVIKVLVKTSMSIGEHINVFGDWFQILFIENKGMAFGMSFGGVLGKYALTAFRMILFVVLTVWISKLLKRGSGADKRTPVPTGVLVGLTLITAGALGNIIDCLFYGLVFTESAPGVVAGATTPPSCRAKWWICSTSRSGRGPTGSRSWAETSSSNRCSTSRTAASR